MISNTKISLTLLFAFIFSIAFCQNPETDSLRLAYYFQKKKFNATFGDTAGLKTLRFLTSNFNATGLYDSTILYAQNALSYSKNFKPKPSDTSATKTYKKVIADIYNNYGEAHRYKSEFNTALELHLKALRLREEINNEKMIAFSLTNIGSVFLGMKQPDKALEKFEKAKKVFDKLGFERGISVTVLNIGVIYAEKLKLNDKDTVKIKFFSQKALEYYNIALKIAIKNSDDARMSSAYNNIAMVYWGTSSVLPPNEKKVMLRNALAYFSKSMQLDAKVGNTPDVAQAKNNIGGIYRELGEYRTAEKYVSEAILPLKLAGKKEAVMEAYRSLAELYGLEGKYEAAFNNHKLYTLYRDSIFTTAQAKSAAEMSEKYESDKKEQKIQFLNQDKIKQQRIAELEGKRKNLIIYFVVVGLLLVMVFSIFLYKRFKVTQAQKQIIEQQKELVEHQKELVEDKNKEITDSINYAKRLQDAILPPATLINKYLPEHFILYKPKDIVAGDFYWFEKKQNTVFMAAADSTGHGVPGALVSVVCSNALHRTVNEFGITDTGKILDRTRELVLETFAKSESEVKDGMDISLLSIDLVTKKVTWSGANNGLCYVQNNSIYEVKAHKQPIGRTDEPKPFPTNEIEISGSTMIYLLTDGYPDQFGGPKGKKFKYKQLEDLILANHQLPLEQQAELFEKVFENWKGDLEQVDDVTIIGVRV